MEIQAIGLLSTARIFQPWLNGLRLGSWPKLCHFHPDFASSQNGERRQETTTWHLNASCSIEDQDRI